MKKALLFAALALTASSALAQSVYVQGHYRQDGTYVPGYYRSAPNQTREDNYSTRGNVNPYTGEQGTRDPYAPPPPSQYQRLTAPAPEPAPQLDSGAQYRTSSYGGN